VLADRQVDVKTGTIRMAGAFDNPGLILRPGMFGRIRAATGIAKGALGSRQESLPLVEIRAKVGTQPWTGGVPDW
jgi:multidrug efflux pump subunit AcrA (membrane-fusion protein)